MLTLALLLAPLAALRAAESPKPNVVYLLADDLGWGDLSRNGGKIPTPAIDKLFTRGVELQNFMGYLDNLRIRRADGSTSSLWLDRSQTRSQKVPD